MTSVMGPVGGGGPVGTDGSLRDAAEEADVHVVVGVDASKNARRALAWAMDLAEQSGGDLRVVTVVPLPSATSPWSIWSMLREISADERLAVHRQASAVVAEVVAGRERPLVASVVVEVHIGEAAHVLIDTVGADDHLVVGTRGSGPVQRALLGSVSSKVVHLAHCPVTVVPLGAGVNTWRGPVVVGADGSSDSQSALRYGAQRATQAAVPLQVLHAWSLFEVPAPPSPPGVTPPLGTYEAIVRERLTRQVLAALGADTGAELVLRHSPPAPALVAASGGATEVVVGSRGRGGLPGLVLGSVSTQLLHHAGCPVTVVRTPST